MTAPMFSSSFRASKKSMDAGIELALITVTTYGLLDILLKTLTFNIVEMIDATLEQMIFEIIIQATLGIFASRTSPEMSTLVVGSIEGVLSEMPRKHHVPALTANLVRILRAPIPTPLSNIAVMIGLIPEVILIATVSVIVVACVSGRLKQLRKALVHLDLWVVGLMAQEQLPGAGQRQHWAPSSDFMSICAENTTNYLSRALVTSLARVSAWFNVSLTGTYRRRLLGRRHGSPSMTALCASALAAVALAAPINKTAEGDVTCVVTDMALASDCPADTGQGLSPGAQGLVASCVVTAVLALLLIIFGIPQWAQDSVQAMWAWLRGLGRRSLRFDAAPAHGDGTVVAQAIGDVDTANATTGETEQAETEPHVRPRRYRIGFLPVPGLVTPRLPRAAPRVPVPYTSEQRDEILAGVGAASDDAPAQRPWELDDEDLGLPGEHHGGDMQLHEGAIPAPPPKARMADEAVATGAERGAHTTPLGKQDTR